jgi:hypothetical protein
MATPNGNNTTVIDTQQGGDPLAGVKAVANELKQNIGDLANAVCEMEGLIKGELLNDIAVAVQEVKQFDITLAKADTDLENFLKKLEEFKLHPVNVQTPAPQIYIINGGGEGAEISNGSANGTANSTANGKDKQENPLEKAEDIREILDYAHQVYENRDLIKKLFEKTKGINNPGENLFEGETGLGNYEFPDEIEFPQQLYELPKSGYWGNNAIDAEGEFNQQALFNTSEKLGYDATSDIAANTGRTLLTDATVETTEVGAALLGDAEVGAIFGPEGMLAALIIGGIYELGKSLLSSDEVNPSQLVYKDGTPLFNPPENNNLQPQAGRNNFYGGGSNVMGYSDDGGVTMQIIHRNNAGNSGLVWGENSNSGADINSNYGAGTSINTSTNTSANNPSAKAAPGSGGIITTIPGQTGTGGYSASGGEVIDWYHPMLPQIYINPDIKPRKQMANHNSAYAPDAAFVQKPFQLLSQFSNSVRHISQQSKCVTINVNIRTNADIHNNIIHNSSFTDKDIQNKIMEVLMAAISDSKVSASTH